MIRIIAFFVAIGLLSLGVAWLADRPGDVVIVWQGMRIKTSVMFLTGVVLAAVVLLGFLWAVVRAIVRTPAAFSNMRRHRRGLRAYEAISNGLLAVGSGDVEAAQRHATAINRLAPHEPLALLLSAQSAQLAGDREGAERIFRDMAARHDTKPLGLHGLYIEAHRRNDVAGAQAYAEEAARTAPSLGWASRAVLEARCKQGDWAGALTLLEANAATLGKSLYRRLRAVLLTAHARDIEDSDRDKAKASALEAVKLEPTLVPAAALAGRMLGESGDVRKATRIIDTAWRANPHPELAQAFSELRSGESARDRLKRIEGAAKNVPDNIESALAVARAAIEARELTKARAALEPYVAAPTKRVALLMADLERADGDEGRAREWLARAVHAAPDPAWTVDGHVSEQWLPASPITGRLDAFEWRVPLTGMIGAAAVIEPEPVVAPVAIAPPAIEADKTAEFGRKIEAGDKPAGEPVVTSLSNATAQAAPASRAAEPVIPLVHAPDDPGPDSIDDGSASQPAKGWRKIFG